MTLEKVLIGGLEVGRLEKRSLHRRGREGALMKAWTGKPELFRVTVFVPEKSIAPGDLRTRLIFKRAGSVLTVEGWEVEMTYRGGEGGNYLFEAETLFESPGFFSLTATASLRVGEGWPGDISAFDEGREAEVTVHPSWVRGARIFEAYTRYFGAGRDSAGNVRTGKIRDITDSVTRFRHLGFDALWSMGVFQRGRKDAKGMGSPYAIRDHRKVDEEAGTDEDLRKLGEALHAVDMKFGVDFVGNHTSWDSDLLRDHPDWYEGKKVTGRDRKRTDEKLMERYPHHRVIYAKGGRWLIRLGHSRYDEWSDTAQLNWSVKDLRDYMKGTVLHLIHSYDIDFFRCDMAMLMQKWQYYQEDGEEIREERWPGMEAEWWRETVSEAMKAKPEVAFFAEVYWGNDKYLQELGFALTYDHGFYRHLIEDKWGKDVKAYVEWQQARLPYGAATLHYIENHDEFRTHETTGGNRICSALMNLFTESGAVMVYNGQMEGERGKPSLDNPLYDLPGPAVDEVKWKIHEELLYLGRRHPELRKGETLHLLEGEDTPYRALIRFVDSQRFAIVLINQSADPVSPLPVTLRLPPEVLGSEVDGDEEYFLFGETLSPGLPGEDPVLFGCFEHLCTGRSLTKEGVVITLRGNSGCCLKALRASDLTAPPPAAYKSAGGLREDLKGVVRFSGEDVVFDEFLIFKHEKLSPLIGSLRGTDQPLREFSFKTLLGYSRFVSPFPHRFSIDVRSPAEGEMVLSFGGKETCALCLPQNVRITNLETESLEPSIGQGRCGLFPVYMDGVRAGSEVLLKLDADGLTISHRDHLLMKNREVERVSSILTIVCLEPREDAVFYIKEGTCFKVEASLEGAIEDDRRISLCAQTSLAGVGPQTVPLSPDEGKNSYSSVFTAGEDGWHSLTLFFFDKWTGIRRWYEKEISVNVVPAWTVGFNGYTIWLRHVRRPGKDPGEHADFEDLRWSIGHSRSLGFNVVLLLPLSDCVGSSPYEQLSQTALDPAYLVMEAFLKEAPAYLFPEERDAAAYSDFKAFLSGNEWVDEYADIKAVRILVRGDRLYTPEGGGFYRLYLKVLEAEAGGAPNGLSLKACIGRDQEEVRTTKLYETLKRYIEVQQYIARRQLRDVIREAHSKGVKVLFDQPLYPGNRSSEACHHPERFRREKGIRSPDETQEWPFVRYDWEYESKRGYEDYIAPFSYFIGETRFDGFRWDAIHTIVLDGQEGLLRKMAAGFNGKGILKLGEQLGVDEERVNPLLRKYGYMLYLVPLWYPGGGLSDTVEKLEERIMLADEGGWWLSSSLHDHPRIADWYRPLVEHYGRLPAQYEARLVRLVLSLFAFFPNFIILSGDEYASGQRINTPGDKFNTWEALPPWSGELKNPDLTTFVRHITGVRKKYPELRRPGGRMVLDNDGKRQGVLSLALLSEERCLIFVACFSPKHTSAWVRVPFGSLGVDPSHPFALQDLLTGRKLEFLPEENSLEEEGAIWVSLRFGDACLLYAPPSSRGAASRDKPVARDDTDDRMNVCDRFNGKVIEETDGGRKKESGHRKCDA